ncbi:MAG TPA: ABC transporter ATP-binding protein [Sphingomonadales bacterium]|nr:ABC transporter ATP-binding protein [Sphingomonadales bacterium]
MSALLKAENLSKAFGSIAAVKGISLSVVRGEILGFLGPNGAGKTTTMKMLTGFLPPDAGRVEICGLDVARASLAARQKFGYLPEGGPLFSDMTALSFLRFAAAARGLSGSAREKAIASAVEAFHLKDILRQRIETLSKGFRRRLALAQALLHDPEVLILDEPTDGLDPNQKRETRSLLAARAETTAIVVSTHILEEVETLCTRCLIIHKGKVVADSAPDALKARSRYFGAAVLRVPNALAGKVAKAVKGISSVAAVETRPEKALTVITALAVKGREPASAIAGLARAKGWALDGPYTDPGRLDDVFAALTRETQEAAA